MNERMTQWAHRSSLPGPPLSPRYLLHHLDGKAILVNVLEGWLHFEKLWIPSAACRSLPSQKRAPPLNLSCPQLQFRLRPLFSVQLREGIAPIGPPPATVSTPTQGHQCGLQTVDSRHTYVLLELSGSISTPFSALRTLSSMSPPVLL